MILSSCSKNNTLYPCTYETYNHPIETYRDLASYAIDRDGNYKVCSRSGYGIK